MPGYHLPAMPLTDANSAPARSAVDDYWGRWTVRSEPFTSSLESMQYLEWRVGVYPLFADYMGVPGHHEGEVILDYGCGPGNDTVHFLMSSGARMVIGLDISEKALELAGRRMVLHGIGRDRVQLVQTSDASSLIPLPSDSVDYVHCLGVIHHTTHPGLVLREMTRVLRPGGRGSIMVYNRDSIFFHLWIAYQRQLVNGEFPGLQVEVAFSRATDGQDCPISRAYRPDDFIELCIAAGLEVEFAGGYFANMELDLMRNSGEAAIADGRLALEHRAFLSELTLDDRGFYLYRNRTAGHGGVYSIRKP